MLVGFILIYQSSWAVKAYPYPVEITQPDGSKITIIQKGDERVKWAQTVDGYSIMRNHKGVYEYAIIDSKNDMIPSGIKAKNASERDSNENQLLSKIGKGLRYSKSQISMMRSISKMHQKSSQKSFPTIGSRKLVCILIGFADKAITKTKTDFENLFNQIGYSTDGAQGSVYDYYKENSYGQLDLSITVAGPYVAAHNMAYYGANNSNGDDVKPEELITEAVVKANTDVNYANFDNDNDGTVDGVYVIYAGYGEEVSGVSEDAIWAHAYNIPVQTLDGKQVSSYSCSAELRSNSGSGITRIGVICHEFGHVLGANDYYDTDYEKSGGEFDGTGSWDLMADGSWNNNGACPAHHNPYTKIYDYKWATAKTLSSGTSISISNAEQFNYGFYRINTATTNEFYLLENRQQHKFDSYIPGHGMVIYHVDGNYITSNPYDINTSNHQGMYPVCASATDNPPTTYGTINDIGTPFPGNGLKTSFTDATTPNMKSWAGVNTSKPITNIIENVSAKTVSFNFMGGLVCTSPTTQATNFTSSAITSNSMTIGWTRGNGNNVLVVIKEGSNVDFDPISGVNYTANSVFMSGDQTGPDIYTIYNGPGNSTPITGLKSGMTYYYSVYEYSSTSTCYLTPGLTGNATTTCSTISTFPYSEGFESGFLSTCWNEVFDASNNHWKILKGNGNTNPSNAHFGTKNLCFSNTSTTPSVTKLVLPAFNLSSLTNPTLQFWHTQSLMGSNQDELKVYYKTSSSSSWVLLKTYSSSISSWTQETVTLPNPSSDYYIAFEGTAKYGNGICLDDISISIGSTGFNTKELSTTSILGQNYPNPFDQSTTIDFSIDKPSHVKLSIFNSIGQEIDVLVDEFLPAGNHSNRWTPNGVPAGLYFYQLKADGIKETKRLIKR